MAEALNQEAAQPSLVHVYIPNPWGHDRCDATLDTDGQRRTCAQPRALHLTPAQLEAELQRLRKRVGDLERETPAGRDAAVAYAAERYLAAHAALAAAGTTPERPEAARRLADAWLTLTAAVERRDTAARSPTTTPEA